MTKRQFAVYPGTFDPITLGHFDIIRRARRLVDHLIIGVAINAGKAPLLSLDERVEMVREEVEPLVADGGGDIDVRPFDGLLMDFAANVGAGLIVRGLRAVSDFEYEFQMTWMNARLNPNIDTIFLMASEKQQFIASRLVKEIGRFRGDISSFVSANVGRHLDAIFAAERAGRRPGPDA